MTFVPFSPESLPDAWRPVVATVPAPEGSRVVGGPVEYSADGVALEGYLARDESLTGPRPAVLLVHDWTGVGPTVQARAHMLARLGYVAFAADVYGAGVRPSHEEAGPIAGSFYANLPLMRARVAAGLARLVAEPGVDASRVVVAGYCFGGSAAIELARTGADVRGAVSFHGRLLTHPDDPAVPVSNVRGDVLVLTGGADPVVPDADVVAFADELRTAEGLTWEITTYSGAPHAFTVAGAPSYRARADHRSWAAFTSFLADVLA